MNLLGMVIFNILGIKFDNKVLIIFSSLMFGVHICLASLRYQGIV